MSEMENECILDKMIGDAHLSIEKVDVGSDIFIGLKYKIENPAYPKPIEAVNPVRNNEESIEQGIDLINSYVQLREY